MKKALLTAAAAVFCCASLTVHGASEVSVATGATKGGTLSGANPKVFKPTKAKAVIGAKAVGKTLNGSKGVTIRTESPAGGTGDLIVSSPITKTAGKNTTLTLEAMHDLRVTAAISSTKNMLPLTLSAGGAISSTAAINSNGGNVTINTIEPFALGAALSVGAGQLLLESGSLESAELQTITASLVRASAGTEWRLRGTVTGDLSVEGLLSPGAQGNTSLQVNGALTLPLNSVVAVNLGGTVRGANYGSISATGAVTLAGALQLDCVDGFEDQIVQNHSFTIISGGTITGTFAGLENGSRLFLPDELGSLKITYTSTSVVLSDWQPIIIDQPWDPGLTDPGTLIYTNARTRGKRHYFRVHTEETDIGAWRSRLNPSGGEADLYAMLGSLPATNFAYKASANVGADGFVLNPTEFKAGQEWFLLVYATPGTPWNLVTGRAFVQDLGTLQWTDTNASGTYNIGEPVIPSATGALPTGGEGIRFYKTTVPAGTPAWSLWLNGSDKEIAVRRSVVPFHTSAFLYDRKQSGQMLVVPPYLSDSATTYFLGVAAKPGETVNLDSRIQEVTDISYNSSVENVSVTEAPYRVYRVQVPVDQIAWDVSALPLSGDPNIAVRRASVPAELDNDAFSEVVGNVNDSVTLVPNFLTNGTWFITVYGKSAYSFNLRNGPPEITALKFADQKLNDRPFRAGWQFYAVTDVPAQLGSVGWELTLADQLPGTEIAIRRNAVPSRWRSRTGGFSNVSVTAASDITSTNGLLQNAGHQADIWYVGVYMATQPLGPFVLTCRPIEPPRVDFDGGSRTVENLEPGSWAYVRVDVPANADGWDVRLRDVVGPNPILAVRRDQLPAADGNRQVGNIPGWTPSTSLSWATGNQWVGGVDWTGLTLNGVDQPVPNRVVMAMGHPLEPGTYYIGVFNSSLTTATSCTIDSRGVGPGKTYPIAALAYAGGSSPFANLSPREPSYFKVTIPSNSPSWELLLSTTTGEAEMVVRRGGIPDFSAGPAGSIYEAGQALQVEMIKTGPERYVLLPPLGGSLIPEGDYYIAIVSQGVAPTGTTIGTATSSGVLTSVGPLSVVELGTPDAGGITHPVSLVAGQIKAYHFDVPPDVQSLEVRLANRVGESGMVVLPGALIPTPAFPYGNDGGNGGIPSPTGDADAFVLTASNPLSGRWSIALSAGVTGDATGTLIIKVLGTTPVDFDGGTAVVTGHQPATVRYFSIEVPAGAEGWDVRMTDLEGPLPAMAVRRDYVTGPPDQITPGWTPWTDITWPSAFQTRAGVDWTGYTLNPGGLPVPPRLVSGMRRPLQPGTYFVGVMNDSKTVALNYKIKSFGIGSGLTYPVTSLDFAGGVANIDGLPPREARYFKVQIPTATPSWEVTLSGSTGEMDLLARQGAIPDFAAGVAGSVYLTNPHGAEVKMKKTGPERYVLMPPVGEDYVKPGDYYLAAVSDGEGANLSTVGSGPSSGVLQSGPLGIKDLGTANASGTVEPVQLSGAQMKAYRFSVPTGTNSLEVRLDNTQGNAWVSLVSGTRLPTPPGVFIPGVPPIGIAPANEYGSDGGNNGDANTRILTVANPAAGEWRAVVRAGHGAAPQFAFNDASADLVVTALSTVSLPFDNSTFPVNGHQPGTWRYFSVQVPEAAAGWDIRLKDVQGQIPAMMIRRDLLPSVPPTLTPDFIPSGWVPSTATSWPSGNQWLAGVDWTGYPLDAAGVSVPPRVVAAMKQPLEAGTYIIGVFNNTLNPTSYTVESRGIGQGLTFPVVNLAFAGGSSPIADLPRREAQYFKVTIPVNAPSWEVTLASTVGESELLCRAGAVPDFAARREGSVYASSSALEVEMQKAGSERYVLLPNTGQDSLTAGDYYLAVVSEGVNPGSTIIGTGNSSATLTSLGPVAVKNLGSATVSGVTEAVSLAGGQIKVYQFSVDPGTESLEIRLEGAVGYPAMSVVQGTRLPVPPGAPPLGIYPASEYGIDGGTGGTPAANIYSLSNPPTGLWTIVVRARHDPSLAYADATGNLVIKRKQNIPLNFSAELNPAGGSHTDTRQAIDGEYNIYRVDVPSTVSGQALLGWVIQTEVFQGAVSLEVYKDFANPAAGIAIPTGIAVVVPPFLTANTPWYIRVKSMGLTNYRISSRPVTLERPAWQMSASFNSTFGDTGIDLSGNPLPGDRGVDLQQGYWHFYAVDVPADNLGLFRTELQAISGNPDLYIREDGVPTINHFSNGPGGATLTPRSLTGATTSYGNWVPYDGRTETRLKPGRWYLGVRAGGNSNVRYRLLLSTGTVKDLALDAATATAQIPNSASAQTLADNDWRYYRLSVPQTAPKNWTLTFSQQVGDVVMWIRDSVPPGQKDVNAITPGHIASWSSDAKNQGPYLDGHDAAGSYSFATPPLRPGHIYYVGMRSNNSATFSLGSDTSGAPVTLPPALDFYTGSVTVTVPANDSLIYRIIAPADASRLKYSATHSSAMKVRIEQGTLPGTSGTQHFVSTTGNSSLNQGLSAAWPWVPSQTYYVRFVNTSSADEAISFVLSGKNSQTEDEDADGLPDVWERLYFNNLSQTPNGDADNDGVSNAGELADGTAPNDANSVKYTLTLLAKNGSANFAPIQQKYEKGTIVTLSALPLPGYSFAGWIGGPLRSDDFALRATGTVTIPAAGTWTFGINAGDGSRLKINGTVVIFDNTSHEVKDSFGQISLPAGNYPVEVMMFERSGGEGLELFAAPGSFTFFNSSFRLVGDVAKGGLAVQTVVNGASTDGFTVRQIESSGSTVGDLGAADNLFLGFGVGQQDVTGVIDVLNFLIYSGSEGHFADNVHFPFTMNMDDNPWLLKMAGNYTITALNSVPLGTAVNAPALVWQTGGSMPWVGENDPLASDSVNAASSGAIGPNQSSLIQTTVTGPGVLTFKWKVSSGAGDTLGLYLDGVLQTTITGEIPWSARTLNIGAGVHTVAWIYYKDPFVTGGSDRGSLDQVVYTPQ